MLHFIQFRYFVLLFMFLLCRSAAAQVIAEDFRNIGCANCRDGDDAYEAFIAANPDYDVTLIYIHNDAPTPSDPFYFASKSSVDMRGTQYNVFGDPTLFIQGAFVVADGGTFFSKAKSFTQDVAAALKSNPPTAHLALSSSANSDGTFSIKVDVSGSQISAAGVKLYVDVIESNIFYINAASYGRTTGDMWNNMLRKTLPDPDGTDAFTVNNNSYTFTLDTTGTGWNSKNIKLVAFIQDSKKVGSNSYPIYAVAKAPLETLDAPSSENGKQTAVGNASQNPFSISTSFQLELLKPSYVKASVSNSLGQTVATIIDGVVTQPTSTLSFKPGSLSAGIYYVTVTVDGKPTATRTVIYRP
ncbi:MAG TPA: Omp28-related outer membrane protein [Candidatus Kapabacteria bacterium]|nr:Omp28-related outer membrane protein [Candidatus Kapabacteria bacterium]